MADATMQLPQSTRQVAHRLGVTYHQIWELLRAEKVPRPAMNDGRYCWSDADVAAARAALRRKVAKP